MAIVSVAIDTVTSLHSMYYSTHTHTPVSRPLFQDNLGKPVSER